MPARPSYTRNLQDLEPLDPRKPLTTEFTEEDILRIGERPAKEVALWLLTATQLELREVRDRLLAESIEFQLGLAPTYILDTE